MSDIIKHGDVPAALAPASFEQAKTFASHLARAEGFVPRAYIGQPAAILAAIVMGAEIGIGPMQSLRSIHVIEGRPQLSADLMLALAIRAGVRVQWLRTDDAEARCKLTRPGFPDHEHSFTIEEAKKAGLAGRGNWSKYAPAMLRARCISAALRAWAPDVLGAGVYVEGEIEEAQPPRPVAPVVPVETANSEPPAAEEDVEDGEIVCAAPAEASCAAPEAPERLADCQTAEEVQAWCGTWGPRLRTEAQRAAVVARAEAVGVAEEDVRRWLGAEAAE